jgi:hypothetical protein
MERSLANGDKPDPRQRGLGGARQGQAFGKRQHSDIAFARKCGTRHTCAKNYDKDLFVLRLFENNKSNSQNKASN